MGKRKLSPEKTVELIAKAAEDKLAMDIKVLDVSKSSKMVDYLIVCGGESDAQLRALEKEIERALRANDIKGMRWEGVPRSGWMILDLGNIVIHLMREEERKYYNLEELWEKDAIIYHY